MKNDVYAKKDPTEIVKKLISRYIPAKPRRSFIKLYWNDKQSLINIKGDNFDQTAEYCALGCLEINLVCFIMLGTNFEY